MSVFLPAHLDAHSVIATASCSVFLCITLLITGSNKPSVAELCDHVGLLGRRTVCVVRLLHTFPSNLGCGIREWHRSRKIIGSRVVDPYLVQVTISLDGFLETDVFQKRIERLWRGGTSQDWRSGAIFGYLSRIVLANIVVIPLNTENVWEHCLISIQLLPICILVCPIRRSGC